MESAAQPLAEPPDQHGPHDGGSEPQAGSSAPGEPRAECDLDEGNGEAAGQWGSAHERDELVDGSCDERRLVLGSRGKHGADERLAEQRSLEREHPVDQPEPGKREAKVMAADADHGLSSREHPGGAVRRRDVGAYLAAK